MRGAVFMSKALKEGFFKLMARLLFNLGKLIMISRRQRRVRKSVVFLFTNLLVLAGIIFSVEILLIILGIENITLPIPALTNDFISKLVF